MIRSALAVTKRTPLAARGMVVAEHRTGAEVGAGILARGGNAVDAAVATAFAMTVVEPFMSTCPGKRRRHDRGPSDRVVEVQEGRARCEDGEPLLPGRQPRRR